MFVSHAMCVASVLWSGQYIYRAEGIDSRGSINFGNRVEFMSLVPLYSLTDSIKEGAPIAGLHVGSTEGDISQALRRFRLRYF